MSALKHTQTSFKSAVLKNEISEFEALINTSRFTADQLAEVYRHNAFYAMTNALAVTFETIGKLVGERFFRAMAEAFVRVHPPQEGNLDDLGNDFPAFISQFEPASSLPYLADIAKLDLAIHHIHMAEPEPCLQPEQLAHLTPEAYASLTLVLASTCAILTSPYPIERIYRLAHSDDETKTLDIESGGEALLITKQAGAYPNVAVLDAASYAFLHAIKGGALLEAAYDKAVAIDAQFDLAKSMQHFMLQGSFKSLET